MGRITGLCRTIGETAGEREGISGLRQELLDLPRRLMQLSWKIKMYDLLGNIDLSFILVLVLI